MTTRRRAIGILSVVLAVAPTPAPAYWIKHCGYGIYWQSKTELVADINPGPASAVDILFGYSNRDAFLVAYNGALYFQADDGASGAELWKVAGGAPSQVANLAPGPQSSAPHAFEVFAGKLFFAASKPSTGEELYAFDGNTIALAAELEAGPNGGEIAGLTEYNGALYFARYSAANGHQVWRFDGNSAAPVAAINALPGHVLASDLIADPFVVFQDRLYFVRDTPLPEHYELWAYDGSGVTKIKALTSGDNITEYGFHLGIFENKLYFGVVVPVSWYEEDELWSYDGQGQPVKVTTLPGHAVSFSQPQDFQIYKGKLYFSNGANAQFFRLDGSGVQELTTGDGALPSGLGNTSPFPAAGRLFVTGYYFDWTLTEPYTFDGATAALLKNIMVDDAIENYPGSFPTRAVEVGGQLYFFAKDEPHGRELWRVTVTTFPFLDCYIVVAPIWEKWWEWPVDRREVLIATWVLDVDAPPRLVSREEVAVTRGKEAQLPVLKIDTRRRDLPEGFALASLVFDRATGEILDRGYDVVGTPAPQARAALERAAEDLLQGRTLKESLAEPVRAEKAGTKTPSNRP
jgi:ELWxxDGT repeat protein